MNIELNIVGDIIKRVQGSIYMKKYLKDTWSMYLIIFVLCFMLFLYEPLLMYMSNVSDFWFSINTLFKMTSLLFIVIFIIMSVVLNAIYFLSKKNDKKTFKIMTIIAFVVFFSCYVQGNYLVGNLPVLDGSKIIWSDYKVDWIISIVLWIIVIGGTIFAVKKFTLNKMSKYVGFISLAIFLMLTVSLLTTYLTTECVEEKEFLSLPTYKNINKYSKDKNFVIFLLDCVDSRSFIVRLNKDIENKDMLKDFTYYPDTMSVHGYTDESVPLILSGKVYQNEKPIKDWATEMYKDSPLFKLMEDNNYELNVYDEYFFYNDLSAERISNLYDYKNNKEKVYENLSKFKFWKQEVKYILFRYLPSFIKKYSFIETMYFRPRDLVNRDDLTEKSFFVFSNDSNYKAFKQFEVKLEDKKNFKFIHLHGAHEPWNLDKKFNKIKKGTYDTGIDSSIAITYEYLKLLKDNNIYDNTNLIIMADHGFLKSGYSDGRQNPLFLVKAANEKHDKMQVSNKPISFVDLDGMYKDLMDGKKSKDLFINIPDKRTRRFLKYTFNNKNVMTEYETKDKAWETSKMYETGKKFSKSW